MGEGARQGLGLSPIQILVCTGFQAQVNQMVKHMISKLNMKCSSTGQRENREVSRAPDMADALLDDWIKTKADTE